MKQRLSKVGRIMGHQSFVKLAAFRLMVVFGPSCLLAVAEAGGVQGKALYVAVGGENAITFVDLAAKTVERFPVEGANEPHAVALSPDRKTLYVGNAWDGKVVVVDAVTKKALRAVEGATSVCGMVWSLDGQPLYLTDMKAGMIHQFYPASEKVIESILVPESLCGLDFARGRNRAFAANMIARGQVVVLDWEAKKVVEKIPVGMMPHHVALTPDGKTLYVPASGEGVVAKIDLVTGKVIAKIWTGGDPHAILISPDGRRGYVTVRGRHYVGRSSLFVLDLETDRVIDRILGLGLRACEVIFAD